MDAQCISNTTRVCLKAKEKRFFLLTAPVTTLKEATFPRAQGFMVLTLDTTKNFSFNPPPSLPLVDTSIQSCSHNHDSHDLLQGLSIADNIDPLTKTFEPVEFLRVDIQKKHLDNGTPEDAYNFFNKHLLGRHGDTATVATKDADYGRQCFRRRPCPLGRDSDKDKDNEYWRYDITCHPHEIDELSKQLLKGHNKEASSPPVFTFPMSRSTNDNSFLIVQRKGLPTLHPLEFYDKLINTPTLTDYLFYIIMRTKFSAIININLTKMPSNSNSKNAQVKWLNNTLWQNRFLLLYPSGAYTPNSRTAPMTKNEDIIQLMNESSILITAPPSITFRDITCSGSNLW